LLCFQFVSGFQAGGKPIEASGEPNNVEKEGGGGTMYLSQMHTTNYLHVIREKAALKILS